MTRAVVVLGTLVALAAVFAIACGSSSDAGHPPKPGEFDPTAISNLAYAAEQDAKSMEGHAAAMESVAAARPDQAGWSAEAQTIRANARSVRFLAESTRAILWDQQLFPVNASAVELGRILGDGKNLQYFGETLFQHAGAMDAHIALMRQEAGSDNALTATIGSLADDVAQMKADGTTAVDAGKALADKARNLARSIGAKIE